MEGRLWPKQQLEDHQWEQQLEGRGRKGRWMERRPREEDLRPAGTDAGGAAAAVPPWPRRGQARRLGLESGELCGSSIAGGKKGFFLPHVFPFFYKKIRG